MHPVIYSGNFMWSIDSSVGKGGQNSRMDDVQYVQWYYYLAARHPNPNIDPARRALYQKVTVTGVCTGRDGDPLVEAILGHQRFLHHGQVDGRMSVPSAQGKINDSQAFFIFRIGARLADMYKDAWPRLDKIPECPGAVRTAALAALPAVQR